MGPGDLQDVLKDLPLVSHPDLIVGMEHSEDAGVFRLRPDLAIIQTVDFFTPVVDDPYLFGQIAVANALSDIYAMGGTPITALNIVCFPVEKMPLSILREVLAGGMEKMREAGVLLVGGHSVDDLEIKYGLAVTGTVHPGRVILNRGAKEGDKLILTKPLGTGVINTAMKADMATPESQQGAENIMRSLNKEAANCMIQQSGVHACTDVTGFGLLGHLCEMIEETGIGVVIESASVPLLPGLQDLVESGLAPGGMYRNKNFYHSKVEMHSSCPDWKGDVFYDPQTSGGLLIAVDKTEAAALLDSMHRAGVIEARIIGHFTHTYGERVVVQ